MGWWTFDDRFGHDSSPTNNYMSDIPTAGPSFRTLHTGGQGYSGYFNGTAQSLIPHSPAYQVPEFSLMFWVFLLQDSTGSWRTILHKGSDIGNLTPTIQLWPKERRLHVRVSTDYFWNEGLDSQAIIGMRRWTHVAVTSTSQLLQLYINGVSDTQVILRASIRVSFMQWNSEPIYLGKDPWHAGTRAYIDSLQLYSKALKERDVQAVASIAMGLISPNRVSLGCESCPYKSALSACVEDFHLCSLKEIYSEGFHMARTMGWFRFTSEMWIRNTPGEVSTSADEMNDPNVFRIGLCCADR